MLGWCDHVRWRIGRHGDLAKPLRARWPDHGRRKPKDAFKHYPLSFVTSSSLSNTLVKTTSMRSLY